MILTPAVGKLMEVSLDVTERSSRRAFQLQSRNVKVRNAWSSAMTTISAQGGMARDQDLMGVVQVSAVAVRRSITIGCHA
jgi:hypothetical protein